MRGDIVLNLSIITRKAIKLMFLLLSIYVVYVLIAVIIASKNSDINFMLKMNDRSSINGCDSNYKKLDNGLFYPVEYFSNLNYWNADYRVSLSSFSNEQCANDVLSEMKKSDHDLTVSVVDENAKVIFYLKKL